MATAKNTSTKTTKAPKKKIEETYVDVRMGTKEIMRQSSALVNSTHGYALRVKFESECVKSQAILAPCLNLKHQGNTALGAYYESMTYACDIPSSEIETLEANTCRLQVDVLLASNDQHGTSIALNDPS